jgi:hypothetical protein
MQAVHLMDGRIPRFDSKNFYHPLEALYLLFIDIEVAPPAV